MDVQFGSNVVPVVDAHASSIILDDQSDEQSSKISTVVYAILSYIPVAGTIIGIKNAIEASKAEAKTENWEKAKIITQIFSFLILPQVILAAAYAINSFVEFAASRSNVDVVASQDVVVDHAETQDQADTQHPVETQNSTETQGQVENPVDTQNPTEAQNQ